MKQTPQLTGGLPLLGHALEFGRDPVGLLRRGREAFGDLFSFMLGRKRVFVLTGPRASAAFFKAPEDQLSAKEAYRFTVPIFGKGVVYDVSPELMSEQLGFVFPALRDERLQTYAGYMTEEAESYFEGWGDQGEVDLHVATNEITTFIASRCLIGLEFRRNLSTEFASLYRDLEGGINFLAFFYPDLPLPSFRRRDRARVRMGEIIAGIIAARKAHPTQTEDFLETLRTATYADGSALTEETITGLLVSLIFAGQHATAALAAWTGLLLFQHPRYLPPVIDEQKRLVGEGSLSLDTLRRLIVLDRAVKEAERLRPPLVMLMRSVNTGFEYDGNVMPARSLAMVSPAVSHRIPEIFRDPDRYDPDRYAPGREEDKSYPYALMSFGGGKHRCIGATFAYLQVKAIWSILLRRFDLEPAASEYAPDYKTFVVGPKRPALVRYRRKLSGLVAGAELQPAARR